MRKVSRFAIVLGLLAMPMLAAEKVTAVKAQLTGPDGVADGVIVTVGEQLVFVDEQRPELSFAIPKSDFRSVTTESGGMLTAEVKEPFTDRFGSRSSLVLRTTDPAYADTLVKWMGLPAASIITRETTTTTTTTTRSNGDRANGTKTVVVQSGAHPANVVQYTVKHDHAAGNCNGRLLVRPDGIEFISLNEPSHSRTWGYGELEKLDRNRDENKVILEGRDGRKESFKTDQMMDEVVYKSIADRIVAARAVR